MQTKVKVTYVKPKLQAISLMSNALSSLALACCATSSADRAG